MLYSFFRFSFDTAIRVQAVSIAGGSSNGFECGAYCDMRTGSSTAEMSVLTEAYCMNEVASLGVDVDRTYDRDWLALAASAIGLMFSVGSLTAYTLGVFIGPLGREFGWTRGQISGAATIAQVSLVVSSLGWGLLLDRFGPRRTLLSAVIGLGTGLALLSRLTGPTWHLYVAFAAVPILGAAANPIGYNGVLVRRFQRRLGVALGVSLMGVGLGAALLPAMAQHVISAHGWRSAYATFSVLALALGLPAAWVASLHARGPVVRSSHLPAAPLWPLMRTRAFLLICGTFFLLGTAGTGVLTHLIPMVTDRGLSPAIAAKIAGLVGISTLVSRGVVGWLLDRIHAPYLVGAVALLCTGMCLLLMRGGGVGVYSVAAVLLGLIAGAEVDFIGFLVRRYFGPAVFGRLYAIAFAVFALGPGAALIGYSYDHFHGYGPGLMLFALLSVLASGLAFAMPLATSTVRPG